VEEDRGAGGRKEKGREVYGRREKWGGGGNGITKVTESGRKREKIRNIAQYSTIEKKMERGSKQIKSGIRD